MARRPDIFDQHAFQDSLRRQGCPDSFISPVTSDLRLFIPLVLSKLGEKGLFDAVEGSRAELGLGAQEAAWRLASKYVVGWANEQVEQYKSARRT